MEKKGMLSEVFRDYEKLNFTGKLIFIETLKEYVNGGTTEQAVQTVSKRHGINPKKYKNFLKAFKG